MRTSPLLHRDNPDKGPLIGHVKVTREDWLNAARDLLVSTGVSEVKILALATRLGVSRSSFYWYFGSRDDLLAALLEDWKLRNTRSIIDHCARPSRNISHGVCNFFRSFIDGGQFDPGLDFAIREWARRDENVRAAIDTADAARLEAVHQIFLRHTYADPEADARARILYFMQLGYHALDFRENVATRMSRVPAYLHGFTGQHAEARDIDEFLAFAVANAPQSRIHRAARP